MSVMHTAPHAGGVTAALQSGKRRANRSASTSLDVLATSDTNTHHRYSVLTISCTAVKDCPFQSPSRELDASLPFRGWPGRGRRYWWAEELGAAQVGDSGHTVD